jgi:hypothetical protein
LNADTTPAGSCCDPGSGALATIDDGDPCTDDVCDAGTGIVSHDIGVGNACDDGNACSDADACDAGGACVGTPIPGCVNQPDLTIDVVEGGYDDPNCFDAGDKVTMTVNVTAASSILVGGQFLIEYDNTCLDFQSIAPGFSCDGTSPFTLEIFKTVDEAAGQIFYAVGVEPGVAGTAAATSLACLSFVKTADCDACQVCFGDDNPMHTRLSDDEGNEVVPANGLACSKDVRLNGTIDMDCPGNVLMNSRCDQITATTSWSAPTATDSCEGALDLACTCSHPLLTDDQCNALIANGGEFPQGITTFECSAVNSCGDTGNCGWTVNVTDETTMDVDVQFQPTILNDDMDRCIEFEFYANCVEAPDIFQVDMHFGGPFDLTGKATVPMKVPAGQWACLAARDPLHTLKSVSGVDCGADGILYAYFEGDPLLGGNWLVGGNLDGSPVIDILDFGAFIGQYLSAVDGGNTPCGTGGPNADINGDGTVDLLDFNFIQMNFLDDDKEICCPSGGGGAGAPVPVTDISVAELEARGLAHLTVADLNHDGRVNLDDMAAFMNGQMPNRSARPSRNANTPAPAPVRR